MRPLAKFGAILVAQTLAGAAATRGQEMQMSPQAHEKHGEMGVIKAEYPRMGRAQENTKGALVSLEQVQKIASESNPTLRQAEAEIRAAKARAQQSDTRATRYAEGRLAAGSRVFLCSRRSLPEENSG
jgi:uncharacterized protein YggE